MRTLLLDNAYLPVKVIHWHKAMVLFLSGRAELVESYDNREVRSTYLVFKLPKVIRLFTQFRNRQIVKFSRENVFYRDRFQCQYCAQTFVRSELTLDHVIPRSKGGTTSWDNVVSCCKSCNNKKGDKLPQHFAMKLIKKPICPKWTPWIQIRLQKGDPEEWKIYLGGDSQQFDLVG
jgi:5-methylcytosine-specific restriction endonuclease McrA